MVVKRAVIGTRKKRVVRKTTRSKNRPVRKQAMSLVRKKAGKKKAARNRKSARSRAGAAKTRGSQASRQQVRRIARRILQEARGRTREEAAAYTGTHVNDIKNLKAGNLPSLKLVLRVVRNGRFDPDALIEQNDLRKLPASRSTRGARASLISARIRKLAKENDPSMLAAATGLSVYTIYQHRVANKQVGLHTILSFVDAGVVSARKIFLGYA